MTEQPQPHDREAAVASVAPSAPPVLNYKLRPLSINVFGTLYAHVARDNPQWKLVLTCEAIAIFTGPQAYVTPSWYAAKQETHKVVPTWNYVAVHAYCPVEFFDNADRLLDVVTRLTNLHEQTRSERWPVTDAPADFIKSQLRGIVGLHMPITRLDGKRKMSQNRNAADRAGVIEGLSAPAYASATRPVKCAREDDALSARACSNT